MEDMLYCCKITDESESPEMATELLSAFGYDFSSWIDKEGGISFHTVYSADESRAKEIKAELDKVTPQWKDMDIIISEVEYLEIKKEDWSEVWKKYFKIRHISDRLVIKPSWLELEDAENKVVVELDPGMSFGTGHHPTTGYCLKLIDRVADSLTDKAFLDAGCGSGILSIAAHKLGFAPIKAFDIDPDAIKVAGENIEQNKISPEYIDLSVCGLEEFETKGQNFDLVAANILFPVLLQNRERIFSFVKPGGFLILAGILTEEFDNISSAFCALGMSEEERFAEKEWTSGLFRRN